VSKICCTASIYTASRKTVEVDFLNEKIGHLLNLLSSEFPTSSENLVF
jgi:hypothetical protein